MSGQLETFVSMLDFSKGPHIKLRKGLHPNPHPTGECSNALWSVVIGLAGHGLAVDTCCQQLLLVMVYYHCWAALGLEAED